MFMLEDPDCGYLIWVLVSPETPLVLRLRDDILVLEAQW